jgi:hypothetical protein
MEKVLLSTDLTSTSVCSDWMPGFLSATMVPFKISALPYLSKAQRWRQLIQMESFPETWTRKREVILQVIFTT